MWDTLLVWTIVGLVVGTLYRFADSREDTVGLGSDWYTSVFGAFMGGYLYNVFLRNVLGDGMTGSAVGAAIGAFLMVEVLCALGGKSENKS